MTEFAALSAPGLFDGHAWHTDAAVIFQDGTVETIVPKSDVPGDMPIQVLGHGMLVPGFVDLQVNGGGGVLLNDDPTVDVISTICQAHAQFGTTALLPTLITDTPEVTAKAISAAADAMERGVDGCLGLHLEGPHLSQERRGAHEAELIRPAGDADIKNLTDAVTEISNLLVTVAPESVRPDQVERLVSAGVRISLGHSNAGLAQAEAMISAGAHMFTHLFNAMSPLAHREPGMVGAALANGSVYAGLIADGVHVDPATMGIALRAKQGPGKIFLVSDAMSSIGSDLVEFTLNGRTVRRSNGTLTLADGTLAGSDIDMISSIKVLCEQVEVPIDEALRMASTYPAQAMGLAETHGCIRSGSRSDFVHLSGDKDVCEVWIGGRSVYRAAAEEVPHGSAIAADTSSGLLYRPA